MKLIFLWLIQPEKLRLNAGYKIPKGWKVMLWIRYLHTNSENFDDPMCFNPDRWNVSSHTDQFYIIAYISI